MPKVVISAFILKVSCQLRNQMPKLDKQIYFKIQRQKIKPMPLFAGFDKIIRKQNFKNICRQKILWQMMLEKIKSGEMIVITSNSIPW